MRRTLLPPHEAVKKLAAGRGDQETSDNERFLEQLLEQLWSRPTTNPKPVSATKTTTWIDFATGS